MIRQIETLIPDMLEVIQGNGGWDHTITKFFAEGLSEVVHERFHKEQVPRDYLGLSSIGSPCKRKLWYQINEPLKAEPLSAEALGTFFYGDLLELVVIALAKAAGHRVDGLQEQLDVFGVKGHGDCIIDGMVVDVKSASRYGFEKFKKNNLREDDPFGYISQLSSYLYGYKDDPRVTNKTSAAFLVVQKDRFKLVLDVYDLTKELANKQQEVQLVKDAVYSEVIPERMPDVPEGKSGNRKLDVGCSYCSFSEHCWPEARRFIYSTGPVWLTQVAKEPRVPEAKTRKFSSL